MSILRVVRTLVGLDLNQIVNRISETGCVHPPSGRSGATSETRLILVSEKTCHSFRLLAKAFRAPRSRPRGLSPAGDQPSPTTLTEYGVTRRLRLGKKAYSGFTFSQTKGTRARSARSERESLEIRVGTCRRARKTTLPRQGIEARCFGEQSQQASPGLSCARVCHHTGRLRRPARVGLSMPGGMFILSIYAGEL
jgi:hypothetical protein